MNKTEIRVTIDSVEKQQRAIEILEKYSQPFIIEINSLHTLHFNGRWWVLDGCGYSHKIEITLDQLDELLTQEKQK